MLAGFARVPLDGPEGLRVQPAWGVAAAFVVAILGLQAVALTGLGLGVREHSRCLACQANLRSLGRTIFSVLEEDGDLLPATLSAMPNATSEAVLACPKSGQSYIYLPRFIRDRLEVARQWVSSRDPEWAESLREVLERDAQQRIHLWGAVEQPSKVPLLWDSSASHGREKVIVVLFADGHVQQMNEQDLRNALLGILREEHGLLISLGHLLDEVPDEVLMPDSYLGAHRGSGNDFTQ